MDDETITHPTTEQLVELEAVELAGAIDDLDDGTLPGRYELVRIAKARREIDRLKTILASITAVYREQIARHEHTIHDCRENLKYLLETGNKVNYPDLGIAYLTTVRAKVEVADDTVADAVARELGCMKEVADMAALKAKALEMVADSGEIPPGLTFVPERKSVTVKQT